MRAILFEYSNIQIFMIITVVALPPSLAKVSLHTRFWMSEISTSLIELLVVSNIMHLKFLPVVDVISCSTGANKILRIGLVDFLILFIISRNVCMNTMLFSRPGQSQVKLYKHLRHSLIHSLISNPLVPTALWCRHANMV